VQNDNQKCLWRSASTTSFAPISGGPHILGAKLGGFAPSIARWCLPTRVWCPAVRAEFVLVLRTVCPKLRAKFKFSKIGCQWQVNVLLSESARFATQIVGHCLTFIRNLRKSHPLPNQGTQKKRIKKWFLNRLLTLFKTVADPGGTNLPGDSHCWTSQQRHPAN